MSNDEQADTAPFDPADFSPEAVAYYRTGDVPSQADVWSANLIAGSGAKNPPDVATITRERKAREAFARLTAVNPKAGQR